MTHEEYTEKCQQLRNLANELEKYAREQRVKWDNSDKPMDYHQKRNYGNVAGAIVALKNISQLAAFELEFASYEYMNEQ